MKQIICVLFMVGLCLVSSSCQNAVAAATNKNNGLKGSFLDCITYENDSYSWNNLTSEMTSKEVLQHEGLDEKDVVSSTYGKSSTSITVRSDSEKQNQYKFTDLKGLADSYSAMYVFSNDDHFQKFDYNIYLNAEMEFDYSQPDHTPIKFTKTDKNFEQIQTNINSILKMVDEKFGPAINSYGTSETTPKFWENAEQSEEEESYFEERFGVDGGSFIISVDKLKIEGQGLIYHISFVVSYKSSK